MQLGPYTLRNNVFVAPMAGVTDRPFRQLCKRLGAGYAVSEMAASDPRLRDSVKTTRRLNHDGEMEPRAVQLAGADPAMMADAARYNVERGAQVIDINMGCPARKVCNVYAGSALMADEALAVAIIEAVVAAVPVPVTVKMRTGPARSRRNAVALARAAEAAGAAMLTVHGRSRECGYSGTVDYATIGEVKAAVAIPVVANGDIDSPQAAQRVLEQTGADAVMIGRAAQGRPWIFGEIDGFLRTGKLPPPPQPAQAWQLLRSHLLDHYAFYGEHAGVRTARKHIAWYLRGALAEYAPAAAPGAAPDAGRAANSLARLREQVNRAETPQAQLAGLDAFFGPLSDAAAANDCSHLRTLAQ
ncbi:MAG TPA: tRNA dihydrouridine synthase DusB [Burkholderiaceae bacterium]|nr:tRNA dihydrouridine synthase DusB [Burkholderiaceae bacterium]